MNKLIALICVISWSGFWAFGYLALSAGSAETGAETSGRRTGTVAPSCTRPPADARREA